jgi:uncharacterized protein
MHETITRHLNTIEAANRVRVLYACESGSRAWGFASVNSDYDVRFIYVHEPDWYLSIDDKRDVIEVLLDDVLDISGWDLRKALKLFRKSNPPLLEWLKSPTVYLENFTTAGEIRRLTEKFFSPRSCMCHYLSMAESNFREYLHGEQVKTKKYFYVLRPVLACRWIDRFSESPPMEFGRLVDGLIPDGRLMDEILALLERKKSGDELGSGPRISVINEYLESSIRTLTEKLQTGWKTQRPDSLLLDDLFRRTLSEVWPGSQLRQAR